MSGLQLYPLELLSSHSRLCCVTLSQIALRMQLSQINSGCKKIFISRQLSNSNWFIILGNGHWISLLRINRRRRWKAWFLWGSKTNNAEFIFFLLKFKGGISQIRMGWRVGRQLSFIIMKARIDNHKKFIKYNNKKLHTTKVFIYSVQ